MYIRIHCCTFTQAKEKKQTLPTSYVKGQQLMNLVGTYIETDLVMILHVNETLTVRNRVLLVSL